MQQHRNIEVGGATLKCLARDAAYKGFHVRPSPVS